MLNLQPSNILPLQIKRYTTYNQTYRYDTYNTLNGRYNIPI